MTTPDFPKIHTEFYPQIERYLARLVGKDEADDLAQEVFIKVHHGLKNFRGNSKLSTWVYKIATNTAMDKLRNSSFHQLSLSFINPIREKELELEDKNVWTGEKQASITQKSIQKEMNDCIREFIERLPKNYSTIMILSDMEGFTNKEIADILELTIDTVKIRLHRARAKLKKELNAGCTFYRNEQNNLACDRKKGD